MFTAMGDGFLNYLLMLLKLFHLCCQGTSCDYYKTNFKEVQVQKDLLYFYFHKITDFSILSFFNISSKFNFNKLVNIRIFNIFFLLILIMAFIMTKRKSTIEITRKTRFPMQ